MGSTSLILGDDLVRIDLQGDLAPVFHSVDQHSANLPAGFYDPAISGQVNLKYFKIPFFHKCENKKLITGFQETNERP